MTSEPPPEDREALSPELVLVSSAEVAQRAREELPEVAASVPPAAPHAEAVAFVRPTSAVPAARAAAAPAPIGRPLPPAYPRLTIEDPPARRTRFPRRGWAALMVCFLGAAVAAGGYLTETRWHHTRATPGAAGPGARLMPTVSAQERLNAPSGATVHAPATGTQPATTSARPAAAQAPQTAKAAPLPSHAKSSGAGFVPSRSWVWAPQHGAGAYEVTFFLEGRVVLRARPKEPRFVLPRGFQFHAGRYRWTVQPWPATGKPIVDSAFVLTPAAAAAANGP